MAAGLEPEEGGGIEGQGREGSFYGVWRLSLSPTTTGEKARLWKRKKPNSPAGNFPPSLGSSCAPPTPMQLARVQPAAPGGAKGGRVVLVRVRQRFHSLNSVGSGVPPKVMEETRGTLSAASPPLHPGAACLIPGEVQRKFLGTLRPGLGGSRSSFSTFPPS